MQAGNIRDAVEAPHHERVRSASMGIANAPSRTDDAAFRAAAVADTRIRAPAVENMTFADLTVATPPSTHGAARESIPRGNTFKRHRGGGGGWENERTKNKKIATGRKKEKRGEGKERERRKKGEGKDGREGG